MGSKSAGASSAAIERFTAMSAMAAHDSRFNARLTGKPYSLTV